MCGRFSLTMAEEKEIFGRFNLTNSEYKLVPRYNIAPGQQVAVITREKPTILLSAKWGFIPKFVQTDNVATHQPKTQQKYNLINARAETIDQKKIFKDAFEFHRCLIIADGFYEWHNPKNEEMIKSNEQGLINADLSSAKKVPYRFELSDSSLFAFAGIYSWNRNELTCSIITTNANSIVSKTHDRMPVILHKSDEARYLSQSYDIAKKMLLPYDSTLMRSYALSTLVNSVKNDSAEILRPAEN